jgi:hypothetical protein
MQITTLQFDYAYDLWRFKMKVEIDQVEIDFIHNTFIGVLTKEQVELAITQYNAHLLENNATSAPGDGES